MANRIRIICAVCGNYTHFEADVETVRIVSPCSQGFLVRDHDVEGVFDAGGWIRLGLEELISLIECDEQSLLYWNSTNGWYENSHITCARCGSRRVSVPYRDWSPPREEQSLDQEIISNRHEFQWLREEREKYADTMPVLQ